MKKGYTDITVVLDRSGSMETIKSDTVGGIKKFVDEQKKIPGECRLSLVEFDLPDQMQGMAYTKVYEGKPISEISEIPLDPRGWTPLLDAVGRAINETGVRLREMAEDNRPEFVVFVIVTDGQENSSREYTRDRIKGMIEEQTNKWKWHFTYLGANQDAFAEAGSMGIPMAAAMAYAASPKATRNMYAAVSNAVGNLRTYNTVNMAYTVEDRKNSVEKEDE